MSTIEPRQAKKVIYKTYILGAFGQEEGVLLFEDEKDAREHYEALIVDARRDKSAVRYDYDEEGNFTRIKGLEDINWRPNEIERCTYRYWVETNNENGHESDIYESEIVLCKVSVY